MKKILIFLFLFSILHVKKNEAIQCYKCESIGNSDIGCEIGRRDIPYANPCYIGENNYSKGNRCIKIVGFLAFTHQRVVIRGCTDRRSNEGETISYGRHLINGRAFTCKSNLCNSANDINKMNFAKITFFISLIMYHITQKHSNLST